MTTKINHPCKMFVGGEWQETVTGKSEPIINPSCGESISQAPMCGKKDIDMAVEAAKKAYPSWASTPVVKRAQIMFQYKQLLEENFDAIARILSLEHGKNLNEARGSLRRGIEVVDLACGLAAVFKGETLRNVGGGVDYESHRFPLGVCAGITPFNFPAMIPLWMFPIAITCGNTFVLKPSPQTPLTSARLVELAASAGLPAGVLNLVHGGKEAVDVLLDHPDIKAVSFVGSTAVAKYIYQTGTNAGKRVQAAGGAKNYAVITRHAPEESTVKAILGSVFGSSGERCMATSILIGTDEAVDHFLPLIRNGAANLRVGRTDSDDIPDMGPVISKEHLERIHGYIDSGIEEGAQLVLDGRELVPENAGNGYFIGPTIFDHVTAGMRIAKEEIFGPVLSIMRVADLDAAIEVVNKSPYGNAAVIFTNDGKQAREMQDRVNCGMIGINVGVPAPMALFPFSGWKNSFFGDLHVQSREGIDFYTKKKVVMKRWFTIDKLSETVF